MAVDKRIQGIRVYVDGKSREIQKKLFELGAVWNSGDKEEMSTEAPFLYIDEDGRMFHGNSMVNFTGWGGTEVKADELLSWEPEPEPEPQLKPFQKVLVRDEDDDEWRANFFSHYRQMPSEKEPHYVCIATVWYQCIPYEGNEHLLGTTDKPNDEAQ